MMAGGNQEDIKSQGDVRRMAGGVQVMLKPVMCHIGGGLYLYTPPEPLPLHHMITLPQTLLQLLGQHLHHIRRFRWFRWFRRYLYTVVLDH